MRGGRHLKKKVANFQKRSVFFGGGAVFGGKSVFNENLFVNVFICLK